MKAFISYSHADTHAVDDLHKHLAMLKRDGKIQTWYDRDILAGGDLDGEILNELSSSEIFFAIVSPDFLDSNYCYEKEMAAAFDAHERGAMHIIPIVVEPCDWKNSPLSKLKAVPKDGKPVSEWTNKNTAWLDVINEIRRVVSSFSETNKHAEKITKAFNTAPSKKYRVQKEFDAIDRSDFREAAFSEIRNYFQASLSELDSVDGMKARFRSMSDIAFTCSIYNRMTSTKEAHITVRSGGTYSSLGDISYSYKESDTENSANGWFGIDADEYELHLRHSNFMGGSTKSVRLTPKGAAQVLWQEFIEKAGVSYA